MNDPLPADIKTLLNEADSLIEKIRTEIGNDVAEEKRLLMEARQAELKASIEKIASISAEGKPASDKRLGTGIHEAIDELVAAIKETARMLR
jgi:hypothetical protein